MKILCYIQREYYQWKIDSIVEDLRKRHRENIEVTVIYQDTFSLNLVSKKIKYDYLIGCNPDDLKFQFMYKFLNFNQLIMFDEGQRNLNQNDKYYKGTFNESGQKRYCLLNKVFGFPKPFGEIINKSDIYYTFFDPELFDHPMGKSRYLRKEISEKIIQKVFIGVSSNWVFSHKDNLLNNKELINKRIKQAAEKINVIAPDLYILHPREDERLIKLLDDSISIISCPSGSEDFINKLSSTSEIEIFTERSGIIFDLRKDIKIHFIDLFERFNPLEYKEFQDLHKKYKERANP